MDEATDEPHWPFLTPPGARPRVVVVGAGPAGMTAAQRLLERGHDVALIEQNAFVGGKLGAQVTREESVILARAAPSLLPPLCRGQKTHWEPCGQPNCGCDQLPPPEAAGAADPSGTTWARHELDRHEHCYHMYLNWYRNFWAIMKEVHAPGLSGAEAERRLPFTAMPWLHTMEPGTGGAFRSTINTGSPWTTLHNVFAGVASPATATLFFQGLTDLLALPAERDDSLDQASVTGFLQSLPFGTKESRRFAAMTLVEAFSSPSYLSSTRSYQALVRNNARRPEPAMWLATADTAEAIFTPWLQALARLCGTFSIDWPEGSLPTVDGVEVPMGPLPQPFIAAQRAFEEAKAAHEAAHPGCRYAETGPELRILPIWTLGGLTRRAMDEAGHDIRFEFTLGRNPASPSIFGTLREGPVAYTAKTERTRLFDGSVVLAVPAPALAYLVNDRTHVRPDTESLVDGDAGLANVQRLASASMFSLDLFFHRPIRPRLPRGICVLLDSKYHLSILDNSQVWHDLGADRDGEAPTVINVVASDVETLLPLAGDKVQEANTIIPALLAELRRFIAFEDDDIQHCRTHLQTNAGAMLFLNQVGSWQYRPRAVTQIPGLFLAGDFCQTPVDVVTVEGAVVSGLYAAEAVRRHTGVGEPVEILTADSYPVAMMQAMSTAMRPLTAGAQAVAVAEGALKSLHAGLFPARR